METSCLCHTAARAFHLVSHQASTGHLLPNKAFCTDCWTQWQNIRQNLDGANEFGVQGMTCPHCQKPLTDLDTEVQYRVVPPTPYSVLVGGTLGFVITVDTKVENFKRTILSSSLYTHTEEFDLAMDGVVLDGIYLGVPAGMNIQVVPRRKKKIALRIYPKDRVLYLFEYETTIVQMIKTKIGLPSHVIFEIHTGEEFLDTHTLQAYSENSVLAVVPRRLFQFLPRSIFVTP